ncbi:MAG TPA: hypothetical protein DDW34_07040 [Clostridium sp.]|nr:hypothetical protein [Clostridium sp.]
MNRFEKRNTVREIEILGNTYQVDFGRDETPLIFQEVAKESNAVATRGNDSVAILSEQKAIFKNAICDIVGDPYAADQIFKADNTVVLHSDVYTFLVNQYTEVMTEESPYSPKRIK